MAIRLLSSTFCAMLNKMIFVALLHLNTPHTAKTTVRGAVTSGICALIAVKMSVVAAEPPGEKDE